MNHPNESESSQGGFSHHTVLAALRCWWQIVVPVSIVAAGVTAAILLALHKPQFTADSWLMITENRDHLLKPQTHEESEKFIQTQMEIIRSQKLLSPLMSDAEIVKTPELMNELDPAQALAKQLNVKARGQSDIYVVSFTSESPAKAKIIVNSAVEAYLNYSRDRESEHGNEMIRLLRNQSTDLHRELNLLREDVRKKSISATGIDPFRFGAKDGEAEGTNNPFGDLQKQIVESQVEQQILDARIKVEKERRDNAVSKPTEAEIARQIGLQPEFLDQQARIASLEAKVLDFEKTGKNLATNPLYKQTQAELLKQRAALEKQTADLHEQIEDSLATQMAASNETKLRQLEEEYNAGSVRLLILEEKFKEGMNAAKQYTGETLELEFARAKLTQVTAVHDAINQRALEISTERYAPSRISLFKAADLPVRPDELYPWKKLGMGAGLAFLVPLLLCVAWEHFFGRITSRAQLERLNQLSIVGEVTSLPKRSNRSARAARSVQRDVMLFEESVDSLRTYLSLSSSAQDQQVVAVCSAVSGEGKTSLAAQLAVCIARATREPTLLIDGDMRSPDVHNVFELQLGPGLAEVLQKEESLEESIDTSFSEWLHVLTAGRLRTNPHRLMGSGDFESILARLKTTYRHIIIDTPPILPASESLMFARSANTAVLCMRRDFSRLDQSKSAVSRMAAAGIHLSGAVLNGIPSRQYAYRYGTYNYEVSV